MFITPALRRTPSISAQRDFAAMKAGYLCATARPRSTAANWCSNTRRRLRRERCEVSRRVPMGRSLERRWVYGTSEFRRPCLNSRAQGNGRHWGLAAPYKNMLQAVPGWWGLLRCVVEGRSLIHGGFGGLCGLRRIAIEYGPWV